MSVFLTPLLLMLVMNVCALVPISDQEKTAQLVMEEATDSIYYALDSASMMLATLKSGSPAQHEIESYVYAIQYTGYEAAQRVWNQTKGMQYQRFTNKELARQIEVCQDADRAVLKNMEQIEYDEALDQLKKARNPAAHCKSVAECDEDYLRSSHNTHMAFQKYLDLYKQIAREHEKSPAEYYYWKFDDRTMPKQIKEAIKKLENFFEELYYYVRHQFYNATEINPWSPLTTEHVNSLLGPNIAPQIFPYPELLPENMKVRESLTDLLHNIDLFYQEMGFEPLPETFFAENLVKTNWNGMCDGQTIPLNGSGALVACTENFLKDFLALHETILDIETLYATSSLPFYLRMNNVPGFNDAVKHAIHLTTQTKNYLDRTKYYKFYPKDPKYELNFLLGQAVRTMFSIFIYNSHETFTLGVLNGDIPAENFFKGYWDSMSPYLTATLAPGQKKADFIDTLYFEQLANHKQFSGKIFSKIMGHQIYKSLCVVSEELDDSEENKLHECDFSTSLEAGEAIYKIVSAGTSQHWQDIVEPLIKKRNLDATALLEYFEPLIKWLTDYNFQNEVFKGFQAPEANPYL